MLVIDSILSWKKFLQAQRNSFSESFDDNYISRLMEKREKKKLKSKILVLSLLHQSSLAETISLLNL